MPPPPPSRSDAKCVLHTFELEAHRAWNLYARTWYSRESEPFEVISGAEWLAGRKEFALAAPANAGADDGTPWRTSRGIHRGHVTCHADVWRAVQQSDQRRGQDQAFLRAVAARYGPDSLIAFNAPLSHYFPSDDPDNDATYGPMLRRCGFAQHKRCDAVAGRDPRRVEVCGAEQPGRRRDGEIGCLASHVHAIHRAWRDGRDLALIAEDDALLEPLRLQGTALAAALRFLDLHRPNWHVLQLVNTNYHYDIPECDANVIVPWQLDFNGTVAYIINRDGMQRVLGRHPVTGSLAKLHPTQPQTTAEEEVYGICNAFTSVKPFAGFIADRSNIHQDFLWMHLRKVDQINKYVQGLNARTHPSRTACAKRLCTGAP